MPQRRSPLSIAPMMNYTDRHFRYIMRLMTRATRLYTEMIPADALLHGSPDRFLAYNTIEHPLALQIGGSDPTKLAQCAKIATDFGYDEINLNVGCPSDRVRDGRFGACLMADPQLVAECVAAMQQASPIEVTVKHRIGIDTLDKYDDLYNFVKVVRAHSDCDTFIVHARIAILGGLSPKDNRRIPPLRYADVYRLKANFPDCHIAINGGIRTLDGITDHLAHVDEVMLGRIAYDNPFLFSQVDAHLSRLSTDPAANASKIAPQTRRDVIEATLAYLAAQLHQSRASLTQVVKPAHILRHLLGLFAGERGTKQWKQLIQRANFHDDPVKLITDSLPELPTDSLLGRFSNSSAITTCTA